MNAYETDEMESLTELLEGLESDESDELAERRRRRGRRGGRFPRPQTAPDRGSYKPQPTTDVYVKKSELARATMDLDKKIATNAAAIQQGNARLNTLADQQTTQAMAIKKENTERKKDIKDLCQKLELLTLLPLLTGRSTRELKAETINLPPGLEKGDKVLIDSDGLSSVLPLLLLGGCGGGGGGGLGLGGEGGSSSLLLVLALSGGLGGKK